MRGNRRGFTLIEISVVTLILLMLVSGLLLTLTVGQLHNSITSANIDLQANVRSVMDWIIKDVRQTNLVSINSNSPSGTHIKFQQVTGIDNSGNYTLSANYTEYTYNSAAKTITRTDSGTNGSWVYNNITNLVFYSDTGVTLAPGGILTSKKLIIAISAQSQVRGPLNVNFSLTEEVEIRNE